MGQHHHGGSQSLPERGFIGIGPVAPLVQAGAGGIQEKLHPVVHDGKLQLVLGTGFGKPGNAVLFPQTAGSGLLDDGLAVGNRHELGVQAVALHRELAVSGNEILQIGVIYALEQLLEGGGLEIRKGQQHPLAGAQTDICLGHGTFVAGEENTAILHPDVFDV